MSGRIVVTNLGKAYKQYPRRLSRLAEWLLPGNRPRHHLHWVLQDINFSVQPGEAVGIIGINGAGKSTLLKLITGTTHPTTGNVHMSGRVAAMLELGMGFHPDFTGRQNAYMAGQLIGLSAEEITAFMPHIEAFAEIGEYIDQPVRVYSSGMQMRLAFSVATVKRPDVLIVDEILSVGDAYFQHKSFERIRDFRKEGTTLLIVSHDKQAIQSICDRAILLNAGHLAMEGEPEAVMDYYNAMLADHQNQTVRQNKVAFGRTRTVSGTGVASIIDMCLYNSRGQIVEVVSVGEQVRLILTVKVYEELESLVLGCGIRDRLGQVMFGTNTFYTGQKLYDLKAGSTFEFEITFNANLGPGNYAVHTSLVKSESHVEANYEWQDNGLIFEVINIDKYVFVGCLWNEMNFSYKQIGA